MKRTLYLILTWPFNDRNDYDRWLGAQFPIPAWVLTVGLVILLWLVMEGR